MQIAANIFDILILIGTIQGFIIGILLYRSQAVLKANRFLSWILFLFSLACLNIFMLETDVGFDGLLWDILTAVVPMIIIMPIGPLVYFYSRSLSFPKQVFTRLDRRHFYWTILDFIPAILAVIYILGVLFQLVDPQQSAQWNGLIGDFEQYLDIPRWLSISYYLWKSWKLLSNIPKDAVTIKKWPQQMIKGFALFQFIWLIHLIPYLLPQTTNLLLRTFSWYPIYVPMVILIYWLGIKGFLMNHGFQVVNVPARKNVIDETLAKQIIEHLDRSMQEEKLFLNPNLKLKLLIEQTSFNQKQISAALNQYLGKNFNEYINRFRVEEAQKRLVDPQYQHLNIAAIAYDCGFNSLATFQRTFKSITGQTPKAFQQKKRTKE